MKYCSYCGSILDADDVFCKHCGRRCDGEQINSQDTGNPGWGVLGFLFPLVGFILYLVWRKTQPKNAKSAGIGCLVNVGLTVLTYILLFILIFLIAVV